MRKQLLNLFFGLFLSFSCSIAQTTITIPLSQGAGQDAYLASGTPSNNYGSHPSMGGNTWTCGGSLCNSRALFQFDLSAIPAGATITNASLQLFADLNWSTSPTTGGPNNGGYLSRVASSWNENGVTWANQPNISATNQVLIPGSTSIAQNYTVNVTSLTQDMVNNGNFGFMLTMQDEMNYYKSLMFASSDNTVTARCPKLSVSYTTNSVTTTSVSLCQGNGEDAYLASGTPSNNYGSHPSLGGNTWTCGGSLCNSRALFKFDLTSIPSGAIVSSASLQLFADLNWSTSPTTGGPNNAGYLSRVTSNWTENTVTWGNQPNTTTTNQVLIPGSTSTTQNYVITVTSLVQDMITNSNYGFMLKMQDELNYYKSLMFASSDNANSSTKCPILSITYVNQTGIHENEGESILNLFPNPFNNDLNIESNKEFDRIVVCDVLGNILIDENISAKSYVLRTTLASGVYFIKIYGNKNTLISSRKVVKTN